MKISPDIGRKKSPGDGIRTHFLVALRRVLTPYTARPVEVWDGRKGTQYVGYKRLLLILLLSLLGSRKLIVLIGMQ